MKSNTQIALGTAQLGMRYGVNNKVGQPSKEDAFAILDAAFAGGVDTFDTASTYGSSEEILGEWCKGRNLLNRVRIISKCKPSATTADAVRKEITESLARLKMNHLDGYLLHSPEHLSNEHVIEGLHAIQKEGLATHVGVSVYTPDEALRALELGLEYIQVPYNVFDRRLDKTDFFEKAAKASVTVFARSPFLQGLLIMEPSQIPLHLSEARPLVERFQEVAKKYDLSPTEAALLFVRLRSKAAYVVLGAETPQQVEENLSFSIPANAKEYVEEIESAFPDVPEAIVNPSLWGTVQLSR